jgi:hypothetical protein
MEENIGFVISDLTPIFGYSLLFPFFKAVPGFSPCPRVLPDSNCGEFATINFSPY